MHGQQNIKTLHYITNSADPPLQPPNHLKLAVIFRLHILHINPYVSLTRQAMYIQTLHWGVLALPLSFKSIKYYIFCVCVCVFVCVCVCVALVIQHTNRMRRIVLSSVTCPSL